MSVDLQVSAVHVRLVGDRGVTPSLHPIGQFEIVNDIIPSSWRVFQREKGGMFFGPSAWSQTGFWEKFFDGDAEAKRAFEVERERILSSG
jgi:hypothetical protein